MLIVKNWKKYQHYKDRSPPWIKLSTGTFQDYDFCKLSDESKLLSIAIWTLAARTKTGEVPNDLDWIKIQCGLGSIVKTVHLNELINKGFLIDASNTLADCKQSARAEERRGERETEDIMPEFAPELLAAWKAAFPKVNIQAEIKKAEAWLKSNPKKHKKDYPKFMNNWLSNAKETLKPAKPDNFQRQKELMGIE